MSRCLAVLVGCTALAIAGCGDDGNSTSTPSTPTAVSTAPAPEPPPERSKPKVQVPSGPAPKALETKDLIKGKGAEAKSGSQVVVQYVGVDYKTGKQFDASWDNGQPFPFQLGAGQVIPGWDQGVEGMRVGGRRQLIIPPDLAYGPQGQPPDIKPNATLVFVVDLLAVQ
jgi:peptidylprolyl isomerase